METRSEPDLFTYFQRVPHKGLARIIATLGVLDITMSRREWASNDAEDFPRVEYRPKNSAYTLAMGVSRRPFIEYTSWLSLHAVDELGERSSTIFLCFVESDRVWIREWSKGTFTDGLIDALIQSWFPKGEPRLRIEQDGLVDATLQHLVHILNEA